MLRMPRLKYIEEYRKHVLSKLDPRVIADVAAGFILCCYEKPNDFCHRRIVAEWIQEHTGQRVLEWGHSEALEPIAAIAEKTDGRPRQTTLFH